MTARASTTVRAGWQALGTSVELLLSGGDCLTQARTIVERQLAEIDLACSRFREDSELARVNANAGRTVAVDALLIEAVEVALRAAELTGGDLDPTVGTALELAGYDRDWRLLDHAPADTPRGVPVDVHPLIGSTALEERPSREQRLSQQHPSKQRPRAPRLRATFRAGWTMVELDRDRATLRVPAGVKLDLGATAKAWAADRASRAVHNATGCCVLVSLGGDIATAGPSPAGGWCVHVTDDHRSGPDAPGQTVSIASGGLATSSTTVRRWRHAGHTMHHILDPSTGNPASGVWRTVSVAAIDCADANIAATASIVRGASALEWLSELGLPARLVTHDGEVITVGSWPTEDTPQ